MEPTPADDEPQAAAVPGTVPPLVERYLEHVRVEKRLAARTVELYRLDLVRLTEAALAAGVALPEVQNHHIRRWVAQMHSGGRSARGIALILSGWRGFYRWLGREALVAANPVQDVRAPRAARLLPKALGVDEAVQLASHHQAPDDPWLEARDAAMVELLYGCGLRVGELVGLDVTASVGAERGGRGWIDLQAAEVHVLGKGGKRRSVPLGGAARLALARWLAVRGAPGAEGTSSEAAGAVSGPARHPAHGAGQSGSVCAGAASWLAWPRRYIRTCCGIRLPATCCNRAAIFAPCRSCWATPASAARRFTPGSTSSTWPAPTTLPTRARRFVAVVPAARANPAAEPKGPVARRIGSFRDGSPLHHVGGRASGATTIPR
jgi:site-specific recombinase XerC